MAVTTLYRGKYLSLQNREGWEYVDRHSCEGAVVIVALSPEGKVILVEQYRIPLRQKVIEFPAGLVNDRPEKAAEAWEEAALREFYEETGYRAGKMQFLSKGPASPGLSSELIAFYLARDLVKRGAGGGDESETLLVHEVSLEQMESWLHRQEAEGKYVDSKVYAGLYFLLKAKRG